MSGHSQDNGSTSSGLLAAARRREREAWMRLDTIYRGLIYHWCRQRLPEDDAHDVTQDVLLSVHQGLDGFEKTPGRGGFRAWLLAIVNSRVVDHVRRQGRRCEAPAAGGSSARRVLDELPDAMPSDPVEVEAPQESERALLINGVLETLRPRFQQASWHAFWRIHVAEQPAREVAAELGLSTGAALMAAQRIRACLERELGGLLQEGLLWETPSESGLRLPEGPENA